MATTPASALALALDADIAPPEDATSERILDAALWVAAASGLPNLTMDEVARRAGVGRMTVYRRFGGRERLVQALMVREARRGIAEIAAALDPNVSAEETIATGFVAALRVARTNPLVRRLSQLEPQVLLEALNDPADPGAELIRGFIATRIREGQRSGELRDLDPDAAAELLFRIGVSFLLMPASVIAIDDEQEARALARTMIAPIVTAA
jgi:AcrR family transcriptional regulator